MYCRNCGREIDSDARFCSFCGTAQIMDNEISSDTLYIKEKKLGTGYRIFLIPLVVFIAAFAFLGGYYAFESKAGRDVEVMRQRAEALVLEGKFEEADALFKKAIQKRPNHEALQLDMKFMEKAMEIKAHLDEAEGYLKSSQFDRAIAAAEEAERAVPPGSNNFNDSMRKVINKKKAEITIADIKSSIGSARTLEELVSYMTRLDQYKDLPETGSLKEDIKKKITDIAYNDADELLKKKYFKEALEVIEKALKYVSSTRLTAFKEAIMEQKDSFEQAENRRIQEAIASASSETDLNKTNAVSVTRFNGDVNIDGNFVVYGEIENIATRPISNVIVYYTVYDAKDNALDSGSAYVKPDYINLKGTGTFESINIGLPEAAYAKIDRITWYIE